MTSIPHPKIPIPVAILAALLFYALLLALPLPRLTDPKAVTHSAPPPKTTYLPTSPASPESNPRLLASPVLFALPTPIGFSSALLEINLHARLTFPRLHEGNNFLQPSPFASNIPTAQDTCRLKTLPNTPPVLSPPTPHIRPAPPHPASITLSTALQKRLRHPLPPLPETKHLKSLQATLIIDPQGSVKNIFFEDKDPEAPAPLQILQYLQKIPFTPAAKTTYGTIEIHPQPSKTP